MSTTTVTSVTTTSPPLVRTPHFNIKLLFPAAANIFERLINDLSKLGCGRGALELGATANQEKSMRIKGYFKKIVEYDCLANNFNFPQAWSVWLQF